MVCKDCKECETKEMNCFCNKEKWFIDKKLASKQCVCDNEVCDYVQS
jgi:hypothetical protein